MRGVMAFGNVCIYDKISFVACMQFIFVSKLISTVLLRFRTLQWGHDDPDGVSNHRRVDCLLNGSDQRKRQSSGSLAFVRGHLFQKTNLQRTIFDALIICCIRSLISQFRQHILPGIIAWIIIVIIFYSFSAVFIGHMRHHDDEIEV